MAHQDTTVVFVPGAFHSPDGYDSVIEHLHEAGYKTSKVYTPTVLRNGTPPAQSFDPDVAEIQKHLTAATDAGQKVVLVMHSYAGTAGSQAAEGFSQAALATQGHKDGRGIIHLVYLASFMLRSGESLASVTPGLADWAQMQADGSLIAINPAHVFYNDFESKVEADRWAADLRPWSPMASLSALTHEPWKTVPTTYVCCEYDNAVPVDWQRTFVRNATEAGAIDLRTVNLMCSHTPFGSKPLEVSQIITGAVEGSIGVASTDVKVPVLVEAHVDEIRVEAKV